MKEIQQHRLGTITCGGVLHFRPAQLEQIREHLENSTAGPNAAVLGGRTATTSFHLAGIGDVIVKHYRRGGAAAMICRRTYLRISETRCRQEFAWMHRARRLGIQTPEPIAFASMGKRFYKAWLISREIPDSRSLAQAAIEDPGCIPVVMPHAIREIVKLVRAGIFHVDLHPGNIVIDTLSMPYVIDFDKARMFRGTGAQLANRYIHRWNRAVKKHRLPDRFIYEMAAGLQPYRESTAHEAE